GDLDSQAVTDDDRVLMQEVRDKIMSIQREHCTACKEFWFDLNIQNGLCSKCRSRKDPTKFHPSNQMFPGITPNHLTPLTQMEEMMISPVHCIVQLWQINGGQYKYTGHICNFLREVAVFHRTVPLLPEEIDVVIL
ncbi:hypothetical protein FISHEDRAFT_22058, partial [Fistulina hepatica ATCC 64428]